MHAKRADPSYEGVTVVELEADAQEPLVLISSTSTDPDTS
jgi:hypothetical protein